MTAQGIYSKLSTIIPMRLEFKKTWKEDTARKRKGTIPMMRVMTITMECGTCTGPIKDTMFGVRKIKRNVFSVEFKCPLCGAINQLPTRTLKS